MKDTFLTKREFLEAKNLFDCLEISQEEALSLNYDELVRKININYKRLSRKYHPDKNSSAYNNSTMSTLNKIRAELPEYIDPLKSGKRCNKSALDSNFTKGNGTLEKNEFEYNKIFERLGITSEEVIGKSFDDILNVICSKIKNQNLLQDLKNLKECYNDNYIISRKFYENSLFNICKEHPDYRNHIKLVEYILPLRHKSDLIVKDKIKLLQKNTSKSEDLIPKIKYLEVLIFFSHLASIIYPFMLSNSLVFFSLFLSIYYACTTATIRWQIQENGDVKEMIKYHKFEKNIGEYYNVINLFFFSLPAIYLLNYKFVSEGINIQLLTIASLFTISILGDILYSSKQFYQMIWLKKIYLIAEKNELTITAEPLKSELYSVDINNDPKFSEQLISIIKFIHPLLLIEKLIIHPVIKYNVRVDLDYLFKKNKESFTELEQRDFSKESVPFNLEQLTTSPSGKSAGRKVGHIKF